jgi:hypothetical protein
MTIGKGLRAASTWWVVLAGGWLMTDPASAQGQATPQAPGGPWLASPQGGAPGITAIEQLVQLSPQELDAIYRQAGVGAIPDGKVRGRAIVKPGTKLAVPLSKATKVLWQGKVFDCANGGAVNKFFGLRMIRGQVYYGESWLDGGPAIILDYSQTSRIYARNRDEIRQVAPGLFLGLMYDRTTSPPRLSLFFALEADE